MAKIALLWPRLPTRLATHFGLPGELNGWSTPSPFLIVVATVLVLLFAMAGSLKRISNRFLCLPNKCRGADLATLREWLR